MGRISYLIVITLAACGSSESESSSELGANAGSDLSVQSCGASNPNHLACCPNDLPQHGACNAGDQCIGFELYCQCMGGQWCCETGVAIYGCERLAQCYENQEGDCELHANQHTLDLYQSLLECISANCAVDASAQSCIGSGDPCNALWNECVADHPMCWF
jgi:hypothetical protein